MKFSFRQKRLSHLNVQRNFLVGFSALLLLVLFLQTLLLFFKNEKIIINPPELNQSYWIEGDRFSKNYLEEMAYFFTHLLLDVSESNVIPQGEILLRYVLPESYGSFKTKLLTDEKRLKKQQLSLCFAPKTIAFVEPLTADITGILSTYVGSQKISSNQETYRIEFAKQKGRLFLKSFETIKPREESNDEAQ